MGLYMIKPYTIIDIQDMGEETRVIYEVGHRYKEGLASYVVHGIQGAMFVPKGEDIDKYIYDKLYHTDWII